MSTAGYYVGTSMTSKSKNEKTEKVTLSNSLLEQSGKVRCGVPRSSVVAV